MPFMSTLKNITSFEILTEAIERIPGRPIVLEALWNGDTEGWFIIFNLYSNSGKLFWKRERKDNLGIVTLGGDIRLFSGEVPEWPEAELAKFLGQKAIEKYGLTFYFPSNKEPDENCPSWTQRHLSIKCAECGKLIIPTDSEYLPKDICYNCYIDKEFTDE